MTIAACYLSSEGIVLGADSTTSFIVDGSSGYHFFNHNQKIFELGEQGTVGIVTWGLASLGQKSYRTLFATLSDSLQKARPTNGMIEVADRWRDLFWQEYQKEMAPALQHLAQLHTKPPFVKNVPNPAARTEAEEGEYNNLKSILVAGFCIAGYWLPDRTTAAFEIVFDPLAQKPTPKQLPTLTYGFWGVPNLIMRLINGADDSLKQEILASGKWGGTGPDLDQIFARQVLGHPVLPVRDAVDFVHTCIYSTIKALKFSNLFQICGGPIELAVITSDRNFRWVRHKGWDSAILET